MIILELSWTTTNNHLSVSHYLLWQDTLLRNQIQPERSATDLFSSNYLFSYIYQSFDWFFKIFHWVPCEKSPFFLFLRHFGPFRAVLAVLARFFHFFWGDFKYISTLNIMGDDHRSIEMFVLFFFACFCSFFGRFLYFGASWRKELRTEHTHVPVGSGQCFAHAENTYFVKV